MRRRSFAVFMAVSIFCGILFGRLAEAKNTSYWLHASYDFSGQINLIYLGSQIKISGQWQKGKSFEGSLNGKKKVYNKRFKISKNCKVIEIENPRDHIYSYKSYIKKRGLKKGQSILNVENYIKVANGKIVKIKFSA